MAKSLNLQCIVEFILIKFYSSLASKYLPFYLFGVIAIDLLLLIKASRKLNASSFYFISFYLKKKNNLYYSFLF